MLGWTAKRRLRDLVVVTLIAAVGYYFWQNRSSEDGAEMTCAEERAEIVAKCQPGCEDTGPIKAIHKGSLAGTQDECLQQCAHKYFHKQLPRC